MSSNVTATEHKEVNSSDEPRIGLLGRLLKLFGKFITIVFANQAFFLVTAMAKPQFIEIGYQETINIDLGMIEPITGEFKILQKDIDNIFFNSRTLTFEVIEYPGGISKDSWFISYNPYTVVIDYGVIQKTNITISLTSPPIASNAIQSGLFKFKITDEYAYGKLWRHPNPDVGILGKLGWRLGALLNFGKYSGMVLPDYAEITLLVKVKPYHAVKIDPVKLTTLKPDEIGTIPFSIQNLGNYNDSFNFRISSKNKGVTLLSPTSITLAPGETQEGYLSVSVPPSVFDYGTIHEVEIETYSIFEPEVTIDTHVIFIETKGVYISEMGGLIFVFLIFIIVLIVLFFIRMRSKFFDKYCKKPEKPWNIAEEKRYLDTLKKKDKEKYIETLKMMQDEYISALLWYKYYCRKITEPKPRKVKKIKKERIKIKNIFAKTIKKPIKKVVEKKESIKEKPLEQKKPEKEIKIDKKRQIIEQKKLEAQIMVDKKAETEKLKKEKILSRIRLEQEQQRNKLKQG